MLQDVKDHAINFSLGFVFPAVSIADAVTSERYELCRKVTKISVDHSSSFSAEDCGVYGLIVGGIIMGASAIGGTALAFHAAVGGNETTAIRQIDADAQAGTKKVLEAASAAGLVLPEARP